MVFLGNLSLPDHVRKKFNSEGVVTLHKQGFASHHSSQRHGVSTVCSSFNQIGRKFKAHSGKKLQNLKT